MPLTGIPTTPVVVLHEHLTPSDEILGGFEWWSVKQVRLDPGPHYGDYMWSVELQLDSPPLYEGEVRFIDRATGWDQVEPLFMGQMLVSIADPWVPASTSYIDILVRTPLGGPFQLPGGVISFTGSPGPLPTLNEGQHVVVHGTETSRPGIVGPQQSATLGIGKGEPHGANVNIVWPNGTSSFHDRTKITMALPPEFFDDIKLRTRYTVLTADED